MPRPLCSARSFRTAPLLLSLLLFAGGWSHLVAAEDVANDLQGHWKLDESSGTTASDETSNGNDGTVNGTADWVAARIDNGHEFDGTNHIAVSDDASLDIKKNFTVAAWIKLADDTGDQNAVQKGTNYGLWQIRSGGTPENAIKIGSTWHTYDYTQSASWFKDEWHHVAFTYDGSTVRNYIDGQLDASYSQTGDANTNGDSLGIGTNLPWDDSGFDGVIDDVRVYDRVLSDDELAHLATWWHTDWTRRVKITFDTSGITGDQSDVPILVELDQSVVDYGEIQDSGQDLRFVDDDAATVLAHEIEEYDESGTSTVWVKVPQVDGASSTDHIWCYFGNASAADGEDAANVWDSDFEQVHHVHDDFLDSTSNGNDATNEGSADQDSLFADGQLWDGADDRLDPGRTDIPSAVTVEAWMRWDGEGGSFPRYMQQDASFQLFINNKSSSGPVGAFRLQQEFSGGQGQWWSGETLDWKWT